MAYDQQKAMEAIVARLADGESLRAICRSEGMPNRSTVMRWMDDNPDFAAKYVRAKMIGLDERAEKLAEDIEAEDDVQRAKLKFEYGRWFLSKLAPKVYGEKLLHADHEGGPLQVTIRRFGDGED